MAESSPNAPVPEIRLTTDPTGQRASATQQVFREKLEIMLARQQLRAVRNPEEKFNLYEVLITLELGHSENIAEPALGDPRHRMWVDDKKLLTEIGHEYDSRRAPVAEWPDTQALPGSQKITKVVLDSSRAPVFVHSDQLPGFLEVVMKHLTHKAYQLACHPMSKWHRQLVSLMDRWDIITIDTEVLSNLASFTTADQKNALARANAHVDALRRQGQGVVDDPGSPGDEDIDETDSYDGSDGPDEDMAPPVGG